jgi:hypothetical protein
MDKTLAGWIDAHVHAFAYFGDAPRLLAPDHPRVAVNKACRTSSAQCMRGPITNSVRSATSSAARSKNGGAQRCRSGGQSSPHGGRGWAHGVRPGGNSPYVDPPDRERLRLFRSGREFAAFPGLVPRQNSSGGRIGWADLQGGRRAIRATSGRRGRRGERQNLVEQARNMEGCVDGPSEHRYMVLSPTIGDMLNGRTRS